MPLKREKTKKDDEREKQKAELGICRIKDKQKNSTVGSGSLVRDWSNDWRCCLVTTDKVVPSNTDMKQLVLEFKKTRSNSDEVEVVELSKHAGSSDIHPYPSGLVVIKLDSKKSSIFNDRPFSRGDRGFTPLFCPIVVDIDPPKPFVVREFQLEPGHDHKGCAVLSDATRGISFQSLRALIGTSFYQPFSRFKWKERSCWGLIRAR